MIVRFDSLNRFERPKFTLCNPGSTWKDGATSNTIGVLTGTTDEEIVFNFNATSTLSFRANLVERDDPEENAYIHNVYDCLQNRRSIFVEDIGYFVITNIEDNKEREYCYKDITAQSCEVEIQRKGLTYIENGTHSFDGVLEQIVASLPKWQIGSVDSAVSERYRTFEEIDYTKNTLAFMLDDMQSAYECIFVFDIMNRLIYVYDQNNYAVNTSIHISHENVMKHLKVTENSDDLYTAVTAKGSDDTITISAINPLGSSTVYNFGYYLDWMSDNLRDKVMEWTALVESKQADYAELNLAYYKKLQEESNAEAERDRLNSLRSLYKNCRDNIVATSGCNLVESYNEEISAVGGEEIDISDEIEDTLDMVDELISETDDAIAANQSALNGIITALDELNKDIESIHNMLSVTNYFTQDEYDELSEYIYEGNYNDEYVVFTEDMDYEEKFGQMQEMYERTIRQLARVSSPTQEFTADVESFLFAKEFLPWSEQLQTGCLINVELKPDDIAPLFLSSMTINYADESMSLTFGNRFNKFDPKTLFENVLGNISKSANTIEYIKELLSPMKNGTFDAFADAVKTSRTLTMNAALAATNQAFTMDAAGITGKKKVDDEFDPHQVKIVNNSMVFTADNWESVHTALGEVILDDGTIVYGINAETIIGEMIIGGELHIFDNEGNDIFKVMDDKVSIAIGDSEKDMHTYIDVTAAGIKAVTAASVEQYDETGYSVSNYGYGYPPNTTEFPPEEHRDQYYLDRNSGRLYKSNGTSWAYVKTLEKVTSKLSSQITTTAEEIRTEVGAVQINLDGVKNDLSSSISQTAGEIRAEVNAVQTNLDGAKNDLSSSISQTAEAIRQEVTALDNELSGSISTVEQTASGLTTKVADIEKGVETNSAQIIVNSNAISAEVANREGAITAINQRADGIELTAKAADELSKTNSAEILLIPGKIETAVSDSEGKMKTAIEQEIGKISMSVTNGESDSTFTMKAGETTLSSGTITFSGLTKFVTSDSLSNTLGTSGATIINGDNIQTGRLNADNVEVTGGLRVYNGTEATVSSGKVGYLAGETTDASGATVSTNGIGVSNAAGDCYLIATEAGIRMQAGKSKFYLSKDHGAGVTTVYNGETLTQGSTKAMGLLSEFSLFAVYLTPISGWTSKNVPILAMKTGSTLSGVGGLGSNSPGTTNDCRDLHFINCYIDGDNLTVNDASICQIFSGGGTSEIKKTGIYKIEGIF